MPVTSRTLAVNTNANSNLVAAAAGVVVRVVSYALAAAGAVDVKFQSNTNDLTGPMNMAAGQLHYAAVAAGLWNDQSQGLFATAKGAALKITVSAAVNVAGHMQIEEHS